MRNGLLHCGLRLFCLALRLRELLDQYRSRRLVEKRLSLRRSSTTAFRRSEQRICQRVDRRVSHRVGHRAGRRQWGFWWRLLLASLARLLPTGALLDATR